MCARKYNANIVKYNANIVESTDLPDILVCVQTQRINVAPNTASEKGWLLRNDAEFHPKILQSYCGDVNIVDKNSPTGWVDEAEQCAKKSGLPAPGSSNNSNLVPSCKCARDPTQNHRCVLTVLDLKKHGGDIYEMSEYQMSRRILLDFHFLTLKFSNSIFPSDGHEG
jgi:hypothetical protein